MWQARFLSANACCSGEDQKQPLAKDACLLLAELSVPLLPDSKQQWQISGQVEVIEDQRPYLLHLRLLQEWLLCANSLASTSLVKSEAVTHPSTLGLYSIVAAGRVNGAGTGTSPPYNGLRVMLAGSPPAGALRVTFDTYSQPLAGQNQYLVKVLPVFGTNPNAIVVMFDQFLPSFFQLRVTDGTGAAISQAALATMEFMIEVCQFSA